MSLCWATRKRLKSSIPYQTKCINDSYIQRRKTWIHPYLWASLSWTSLTTCDTPGRGGGKILLALFFRSPEWASHSLTTICALRLYRGLPIEALWISWGFMHPGNVTAFVEDPGSIFVMSCIFELLRNSGAYVRDSGGFHVPSWWKFASSP